jgi:hypothetical protein
MSKVVISNMMRCKNKQSFFALYQIQKKIHNIDPTVDVEFHILWDTDNNIKEKTDDPHWAALISTHIKNIVSYDREFFRNYVRNCYGSENIDISKFDKF